MTVYVLEYIGISIHGYVSTIRTNNTTLILYIPKSYIFTFTYAVRINVTGTMTHNYS